MEEMIIDGLRVELTRKRIKNLNLRIVPPEGRVVVSAPLSMHIDKVSEFVSSRSEWIKKQREKVLSRPENRIPGFNNGEVFTLFGNSYTLEIINHPVKKGVLVEGENIKLFAPLGSTENEYRSIIDSWLRSNLEVNLKRLVRKWEPLMGVSVKEIRIRKMKTRWGTCNPRASRIWFSLMLARRRPELVEYIVVHEMVHLLEASHNRRFYSLMDRFLPGWKTLRRELR